MFHNLPLPNLADLDQETLASRQLLEDHHLQEDQILQPIQQEKNQEQILRQEMSLMKCTKVLMILNRNWLSQKVMETFIKISDLRLINFEKYFIKLQFKSINL